MITKCSHCSQYFYAQPEDVGKTITCRGCGKDVVVTRQPDFDNSIPPVTSGDGCMALFDFKFCKFVSPSLMRILYIIWFGVSLLGAIVGMIYLIKNAPSIMIPIVIMLTPIAWILNLIVVRTGFELAMAIFNMERLARQIEKNTRRY